MIPNHRLLFSHCNIVVFFVFFVIIQSYKVNNYSYNDTNNICFISWPLPVIFHAFHAHIQNLSDISQDKFYIRKSKILDLCKTFCFCNNRKLFDYWKKRKDKTMSNRNSNGELSVNIEKKLQNLAAGTKNNTMIIVSDYPLQSQFIVLIYI